MEDNVLQQNMCSKMGRLVLQFSFRRAQGRFRGCLEHLYLGVHQGGVLSPGIRRLRFVVEFPGPWEDPTTWFWAAPTALVAHDGATERASTVNLGGTRRDKG